MAPRYLLTLLLPLIKAAAPPQIEIRDNQVWLLLDGTAKRLTQDTKVKIGAILSPAKKVLPTWKIALASSPAQRRDTLFSKRLHADRRYDDLSSARRRGTH